jgi:hypothetical protein
VPFVKPLANVRPDKAFAGRKFGYNLAIGTTEESIWAPGGTYPWATSWDLGATSNLTIKSTSTNDAVGGSGIITVLVSGLNGDGYERDVTVTLSGTNTVSVPGVWTMIHRIAGQSHGGDGVAAGNIGAYYNDSVEVARLPIGDGSTQQCVFRMPKPFTGWLYRLFVNIGAGDTATFFIKQRQASTGVWVKAQRFSIQGGRVILIQEHPNEAISVVAPGDDIEVSAISSNASGSAGVASVIVKAYVD